MLTEILMATGRVVIVVVAGSSKLSLKVGMLLSCHKKGRGGGVWDGTKAGGP